ncbi:MAG: hypothetical protein IIB22_06245 [Chloroflexi bacterium]|nr:hypothetical protein [Chloroflexota bacterium]
MNIVSVGRRWPLDEVTQIQFRSRFTLLDYELVLWDPSSLIYEYGRSEAGEYRGCPSLDPDSSVRILDDRTRRRDEIVELVKLGRVVVIFVPPPLTFYVDSGERSYSGTGQNRITEIQVNRHVLSSFMPIDAEFSVAPAEGFQVDFRGDAQFAEFWNTNRENLFYKAYFKKDVGRPFLFVKGTERAVGTWLATDHGNVIFLPHFAQADQFAEEKDYEDACRKFISSLGALTATLQESSGDFTVPPWAKGYRLPFEEQPRELLDKAEKRLKAAQLAADKRRAEVAELEKFKLLISGQGPALESQVMQVFQALGADVQEGPPGRSDLVISFDGQVAVAEVKGKKKSAAEADAAQLEKWVSEHIAEHQTKPKALLIVNAFCGTPLAERSEPAFPNQMLKYSVNREHCLVTSVQLLGILLSNKTTAQRKSALRSLLKTVGVFEGDADMSKHFSIEQAAISVEADSPTSEDKN